MRGTYKRPSEKEDESLPEKRTKSKYQRRLKKINKKNKTKNV